MLDSLVQQFAGSGHESLQGDQLHGGVAQMLQSAPGGAASSAIEEAIGALGGGGFGESVAQGATNATPEQRGGLAGMLLNAVSQGGGSPDSVLSTLGIGNAANPNPQELGALAGHVASNHPSALAGILADGLGGGGGGGGGGGSMMSLLGSPMVRQIGISLAQKML